MALLEQLKADLKSAMKQGRSQEVNTIRMVLSAVKNRQIELKTRDELPDVEVLSVLQAICKKHKDSIEQFQQGKRPDLVEKETRELDLVKNYLPKELTISELDKLIAEKISELKPAGPKDMGRLMQAVIPLVKGRADGKLVSERVRVALQGSN